MAYEYIFSSSLGQAILAFLLVFTVVFAVLQKSEILGKGKRQIDALVALAIGLIVISVGSAMNFIQQIIPFMVIALVILLVFMLLLGMLFKEGAFDTPGWVKIVFGIIIFIAVVIAVLIFSGGWDFVAGWFTSGSNVVSNIVLVVIIILAIIVAYFGGGSSDKKKE